MAEHPFRGRFVADQAEALVRSGGIDLEVVDFDPFWLHGNREIRSTTALAWPRLLTASTHAGRLFVAPGTFTPPQIPVARVGAPVGTTGEIRGADHEAIHRATSLRAVLDAYSGRWPLIHAHVGYPDGAAVAMACAGRVPFILTEHATYLARLWSDDVVRARYLETARAADRIVAVSQVLADQIQAEFSELRGRVVVIPNAVDVDAFTPTPAADRDPDELLWVGYRREVKGTPTLLRAFALARSARPSLRLRLVGASVSDAEEERWHRMAVELGIADGVQFDGPADRAGVAAAMERAAVFVHPSTRETMGIVAAEALAAGLPVVATDSGGVTEVLGPHPEAFGALVPSDDPGSLADAVLATLDRRGDFDAGALRNSVEARFGATSIAGRLADLYRSVLAESRPVRKPVASAERGSTEPSTLAEPRPLSLFAGRVVVVSMDHERLVAARSAFPAWVFEQVAVATVEHLSPDTARHVGAYLSTSADATVVGRTPGELGRSMRAWIRRSRSLREARRRVPPLLDAALEAALKRVGATPATPALLVCVGGIDIHIARFAVKSGRAVVAPGGIRWLADARHAEGQR
ncbi:MAG TPA: glycosyltransferase [Candidatus Limnocylindrales bacterium]|nr:glycosyltransferase [Candidatus Limnocylindrales bacterium]